MIEAISAIITLASVVVAIWLGVKNHRLARKNTDLQKRLVELEEERELDRKKAASKAQLRATLENYGQHNYRLVIENIGNCEARNIVLQMDGKLFADHPAAMENEGPIRSIGPHTRVTKLLAITMGCAPPFELDITWEDDSGEPRHYRTTLTF